jgi:hypothetical protein
MIMKKTELWTFTIVAQFALILACASANSENSDISDVKIPSQTVSDQKANSVNQKTKSGTKDVQILCSELRNIKKIPYEAGEVTDDLIYDGLIAKGKDAIPCLVEKITDITVIEDPRIGDPHIHGFTVGDAAVFILCDITGISPEQFLPGEIVKKRWKDQGIYLYFEYVERSKNRLQIQRWWQKRTEQDFKK